MGNVTVRVFTLDQIGPEGLTGLFADPNGHIAMCDGKWAGMVRSNPHAQPGDLTMLLALDDQTVVGRLGFFAHSVSIAGKSHRVHYMDGYFLDEAYRTSGVGGLIMLQASARCKSILACGGPSESAQKLYKAAGLKEIGPLRRWIYFTRGIGPARKVLGPGPLAAIASPFAGLSLRAMYFSRRKGARPRLAYTPVTAFSPEVDSLYNGFQLPHFPRTSSMLNWALNNRDLSAFELRDGPRLVGYLLLKRNTMNLSQHGLGTLRVGWVVDYFLSEPTPQNKRDLAMFVIDHFRSIPGDGRSEEARGHVDVVDFQTLDPEMDGICRSLGMVHRGGLRVLFRPPPGVALPEDGRWFLTAASGDMLLAPP